MGGGRPPRWTAAAAGRWPPGRKEVQGERQLPDAWQRPGVRGLREGGRLRRGWGRPRRWPPQWGGIPQGHGGGLRGRAIHQWSPGWRLPRRWSLRGGRPRGAEGSSKKEGGGRAHRGFPEDGNQSGSDRGGSYRARSKRVRCDEGGGDWRGDGRGRGPHGVTASACAACAAKSGAHGVRLHSQVGGCGHPIPPGAAAAAAAGWPGVPRAGIHVVTVKEVGC